MGHLQFDAPYRLFLLATLLLGFSPNLGLYFLENQPENKFESFDDAPLGCWQAEPSFVSLFLAVTGCEAALWGRFS